MAKRKYVFFFGAGSADGSADMKDLLGGKGANLAEMCNLDIPVPAGFTISTKACVEYFKSGSKWPKGLDNEIEKNVTRLEKQMGKKLNDSSNPLLLSVRSGARASMPGMMDTILDLGLNDKSVIGLANKSNNEWFAYDSYRRFIMMFSDVALGVDRQNFEKEIVNERKKMAL